MSSSPAVSVLITCFNLGLYLDEAVDSVLAQTFEDFEILIVDDGSTDPATRQLLDAYSKPKTRVFRTANQGLAAARNFLVARAQGTYLSALDADDKLHPRYLEKTVAALELDPSLSFVSTHLRMFGDEDRLWPTDARCDLVTLLCEDTVSTPALVRRAAVAGIGGYDEGMPHQGDEDWDLWISLVEAGHAGTILPDVLFYYRRRPGSMCVQCTSRDIHLELLSYLLRKHRDSYRTHLLPVLVRKEERVAQLRRTNVQLEAEQTRLEALRDSKRVQLRALRARLDTSQRGRATHPDREQDESSALRQEYQRVLDEVAAFRSSWSWRVTAPLRRAYELLVHPHPGPRR